MASYKINYHLTNCTTTAASSENYDTDGNIIHFCGKAPEGCYFLPNDGDYNYISRLNSGTTKTTPLNLSVVSSGDNAEVISGNIDGISSDGKYFSKRLTFSPSNTGEMECYLNARGGTPTVKTLTIKNNISGTNAVSVQNGKNFDITLTGDTEGTFTVTPVVTYRNKYNEASHGTMVVNGNVATFSVPVENNKEVTINGTFTPKPKELTITNHVSGTVATYVKNGKNFDITLTGDTEGTFTVTPVVTYRNKYNEASHGTMVVNGNVATFSVPVENNKEVTINGTFTPKPKELTITNHVSGTVATYVKNGKNFDITLTGSTGGSYSVVPVVSYRNESGTETTGEMNVDGKIASFSVPVATNETVTITGTFTPETSQKDVPVTYALTNCTVSPQLQTVKTGSTLNLTVTPFTNYRLDSCNIIWNDGTKYVTISVTGGVISFPVPDSCVSINIKAAASIIDPVGRNYGAINVYCVTLENLDAFSKQRFFEIQDDTQGIYEEVNLGIFVNRIKRIFANVPVSGTDSLRCGNYNTGITVQTPEKDVLLLDFGDVTLTGLNGDSEDYNAQISVFIPCRGFVAVDNKYIGKTVNLSFKVNVITGDAVAFLSCGGVIFQLESFSLSCDVIYKTGTIELNSVGGTNWNEQILYGLEPYVLITENLTVNVPVNNTQENVTVKDVTGFAQFENVNLNTANLLVDEYNTIISELENGVYL